MNSTERIIRYLDNNLTENERKLFEEELNSDKSLRHLYEEYAGTKNILNAVKKSSNVEPTYFENIIPRFRARINNSVKIHITQKLGLAYAIILMLMIGYFLFIPDFSETERMDLSLQEISESLDDSEINNLIHYLNGESGNYELPSDYIEIELDNLEQLISQVPTDDSRLWSEFEINDISYELTSGEADIIYNDLSLRNF